MTTYKCGTCQEPCEYSIDPSIRGWVHSERGYHNHNVVVVPVEVNVGAFEAFEKCAQLLEGSAALHFAYSDKTRDRFCDAQDREKWNFSAEFLADAARKIRKMQEEVSR